MSKGDNRRPTAKSFETNFDKLDWSNNTPAEPSKMKWEWDAEEGQWYEVLREAPPDDES